MLHEVAQRRHMALYRRSVYGTFHWILSSIIMRVLCFSITDRTNIIYENYCLPGCDTHECCGRNFCLHLQGCRINLAADDRVTSEWMLKHKIELWTLQTYTVPWRCPFQSRQAVLRLLRGFLQYLHNKPRLSSTSFQSIIHESSLSNQRWQRYRINKSWWQVTQPNSDFWHNIQQHTVHFNLTNKLLIVATFLKARSHEWYIRQTSATSSY
jgi:hypothetical protein